jgi:hypothetical protein
MFAPYKIVLLLLMLVRGLFSHSVGSPFSCFQIVLRFLLYLSSTSGRHPHFSGIALPVRDHTSSPASIEYMSPEYRQTLRRSQMMTMPTSPNKQPLRLVSVALAILSVCLSIAIIGTAADAYSTYKSQAMAGNPWWLPLWPGYFNTRGTKSQIGAAVGVLLFNGSFVVLCLVPKVSYLED